MRCWQANVEITRATNLQPALWSLCHQLFLRPSIKVMKCSILNWHNHRAKSSLPPMHQWHIMKSNKHDPPSGSRIYHTGDIWVPAGVAVLTRTRFANNVVTVSVKTYFFTSMKSTFVKIRLQHSHLGLTVSKICESVVLGVLEDKRKALAGTVDRERVCVCVEGCCHQWI